MWNNFSEFIQNFWCKGEWGNESWNKEVIEAGCYCDGLGLPNWDQALVDVGTILGQPDGIDIWWDNIYIPWKIDTFCQEIEGSNCIIYSDWTADGRSALNPTTPDPAICSPQSQ